MVTIWSQNLFGSSVLFVLFAWIGERIATETSFEIDVALAPMGFQLLVAPGPSRFARKLTRSYGTVRRTFGQDQSKGDPLY